MNSLEQILQKIEEDGKKKAEEITASAKKESECIIELEEKSAKKEAEKILESANKKAQITLKNAYDFGETQKKNGILKAKAKIFEDFVSKAESEFENAPNDEYFEILGKLILKYCENEKTGELIFSKKDKERLPRDFLKKANEKISSKNASLTLSEETANIKNGFIIRYGLIEQNCSFSSLFEDKKDEIRDTLMSLLKEEE